MFVMKAASFLVKTKFARFYYNNISKTYSTQTFIWSGMYGMNKEI